MVVVFDVDVDDRVLTTTKPPRMRCITSKVKLTLLPNDMVVDTNIHSEVVGRGLRALCNVTI